MKELDLPFPIVYMEASIPANSQDWLPPNIVDWFQRILCCTRSHIRALELSQKADAPLYTIVLEDDVALHESFCDIVTNLLQAWDASVIGDMCFLGFVPKQRSKYEVQTPLKQLSPSFKVIPSKQDMGTQGYIVKRGTLDKYMALLSKSTWLAMTTTVQAAYPSIPEARECDILFCNMFKQTLIYPPLVIEQQNNISLLNDSATKNETLWWEPFFKDHKSDRDHYWPPAMSPNPNEVCFAILAKNKAGTLPFFLECLLRQTYPKSNIHLYIRTNDNTDDTAVLLQAFVKEHGSKYASVFYDDSSVNAIVTQFRNHEWNATRFKLLGKLRQDSVEYAKKKGAHYFVADCDNFITSITLEKMLEQTALGVVAPMLTTNTLYSNYHYDIDANGYMKDHPKYINVLQRTIRGCIQLPVVHCTYFISNEILQHVNYDDGSARYEYVIFSDVLRKKNIPQYLDNRFTYGFLTMKDTKAEFEDELSKHYLSYLSREFYNPTGATPLRPTFKVWLSAGLGNRLFQLASIKGLAQKYKCDFQVVGYNTSHGTPSRSWILDKLVQEEPPYECSYNECRTKSYTKGYKSYEQLVIHHQGFHEPAVKAENTLFYGYYQSELYFKQIQSEIRAMFAPSQLILNQLHAFEQTLPTSFQKTVAIHIRLGDYLQQYNKPRFFIDLSTYYKNCVEELCANTSNTGLHFLLVCQEPDQIDTVYPSLRPLLQTHGTVTVSGVHTEEFDLFLLASCSTVICGNSTFAWWGSWLNTCAGKRVYHPDRWMTDHTNRIEMEGAIVLPTDSLVMPIAPAPQTHFITFGSHGNFIDAANRLGAQVKASGLFNTITIVTGDDLKRDVTFWQTHKSFIESNPRGYGYWIWKSYIIKQQMDKGKDGDLLLYLDCGCELDIYEKDYLLECFEAAKKDLFVGTVVGCVEKHWTKMDLILKLDMKDDPSLDTHQRQGGVLLFLVCDKTRDFVNQWYSLQCEYHLVDNSPSLAPNYPNFAEHRHDQSILSLLSKKYNIFSSVSLKQKCMKVLRNISGISKLPVRLTTVLGSVNNNPNYYLFIPKQIAFWRKFGIKFLAVVVGQEIPAELAEYKEHIILWSKNVEQKSEFVAQHIRMYYPALLSLPENEFVMITDMDMLPTNGDYYTSQLHTYSKNDFIYYRDIDGAQIYICYNAAHPSTWAKVFQISSEADIELRLKTTYMNDYDGRPAHAGWWLDQNIMYKHLSTFPHLKILNRPIKRLEVHDFKQHLQTNDVHFIHQYDDFHAHRNYKENLPLILNAERQLMDGANGKVLMLIISSNNKPVYRKHKEIWCKYMRTNPSIDCFFIEHHDGETTKMDNTIYIKGDESHHPGIREKTIECLDYFIKRGINYDYIVRTNLSSVWNFDCLLRHVNTLEKSNVYAGVIGNYGSTRFISGSGMIMSQDVAKLLVKNRVLLNHSNVIDDVDIGYVLGKLNVPLTTGFRHDFYSMSMFKEYTFNKDVYHYRFKWDDRSNRLEEPLVMMKLLEQVIDSRRI